jgi:RNA polymerase sigma-70 factor (ECF subfamily)
MIGRHHPTARPSLRPGQLARLLQTLAPAQVQALALRVFGGLSVAEVAQVMGKNDAEVKMLIRQAVRELLAQLALVGEGNP